jgi:hypothetical protein
MTNDFIFGTLEKATTYAKAQGWKPTGRGQWEKGDGTCVYLITFLEQFEAKHRGQRVYVLRELDALEVHTLKNLGAEIVKLWGL